MFERSMGAAFHFMLVYFIGMNIRNFLITMSICLTGITEILLITGRGSEPTFTTFYSFRTHLKGPR
ncbi:MAG TPA: hypothetical protein DCP40_04695 [Stenotrophomonas sp.]|nr:hypothetical protein [Stenotrophomonas sp.]